MRQGDGRDGTARDESAVVDEAAVIAWLREHPDLLARHPELVEGLALPHDCGDAVSLVAYQVAALREKNRDLHRRLRALVRNARRNEELGARLHRLTLDLVACVRADEALARLYETLGEELRVDFSAVRLFAVARNPGDAGLAEFDGGEGPARALLAPALEPGRPVCGPLDGDRLQVLFDGAAAEVGSAALIPLGERRVFGVLALASRAPERYHAGMGTTFLRQLGETVSSVFAPHLDPD